MIKVVPLDDKGREVARTIEDYYNIVTPKEIEEIKGAIFGPREGIDRRKDAYAKHKDKILKLKPYFRQLVTERNNLAREKGFENYFEYAIHRDDISEDDLEQFFKNVDRFMRKLNATLSDLYQFREKTWSWTRFNLPYFSSFKLYEKLNPQEYSYSTLLRRIEKEKLELKDKISRIELKTLEKDTFCYPKSSFDEEKETVTIHVPFWRIDINNICSFFHEVGHAVTFASFMNDGKHPWSKGRYWHEKEAIKMGADFERLFLPQRIQKIARIDLLRTFTQSLFERKVYNNPSADFDQIYAEVINRCYLEANQQENPFYVLDNYLVGRPCNTVMFSVARTLVDLGLRSK